MSAITDSERTYVLGHSDEEIERLHRQADFYAPLTAQALQMVGIQPGMRVLDAGCGAGDVSVLLSRMVGSTGEVIAVDAASDALAETERRCADIGATNVHLLEADVAGVQVDAHVDVVVGRMILMHVSDPVGVVRNLASALDRSGILLIQEMDIGVSCTEPPVPLAEEMLDLCRQAFARAGVDCRPGIRLYDQFLAAGLPAPRLLSLGRIEPAPAPASGAMLAAVLRTLLPAIEATGLATADELDLATLPERIGAAATELGSLVFPPPLITAWTRIA